MTVEERPFNKNSFDGKVNNFTTQQSSKTLTIFGLTLNCNPTFEPEASSYSGFRYNDDDNAWLFDENTLDILMNTYVRRQVHIIATIAMITIRAIVAATIA